MLSSKIIGVELLLYICNHVVSRVPFYFLRRIFYRRFMLFDLHDSSTIAMNVTFDSRRGLVMGKNSTINPKCRMDTRGGILINKNVSISEEVIVLTASHDPNTPDLAGFLRSVAIGDNVWIGTRATILPGIILNNGAIVAAGAVVTRNAAENSVVAGVPARAINMRNPEISYTAYYRRLFH